jgi:thiol-disulfide isomerase/thioredoxin
MIKSAHFWVGAILMAIIPLVLVDIVEHYLSWQTEVREQIIFAVQDVYNFSKAQKAAILDNAFAQNQALTLLIVFKAFLCLVFLITGIYLLKKFAKAYKPGLIRPLVTGLAITIVLLAAKVLWTTSFNTAVDAKFINLSKGNASFEQLIKDNIKGKVVYADFWGTTCGPCLAEFENFTRPLKEQFKSNPDIAYLYVCRGNRYLWKRQIEKYQITGYHIFLDDKDYDNLYHSAINNDTATVYMPRYVIANREGKVVNSNAQEPSDQNTLFEQLGQYLKGK